MHSPERGVNGRAASTAGFGSIDAAMAELDMEHYDSDDAETSGQVPMHSCNQPCFTCLSHAYSTSVLYVLLFDSWPAALKTYQFSAWSKGCFAS